MSLIDKDIFTLNIKNQQNAYKHVNLRYNRFYYSNVIGYYRSVKLAKNGKIIAHKGILVSICC